MARVKIHKNGKKFLKSRNKDVGNKVLVGKCMEEKIRKEDKTLTRDDNILTFAN